MTRVKRYDVGELQPARELANGFLIVEGRIGRVGIQVYEDIAGRTHRELRLPEEVFAETSLATFRQVPLTNQHPPILLTKDNARQYTVGNVGENIRRDGIFMVAPLAIQDATAIEDAKAGRVELSNGYECELDPVQDPKLVAEWGPYDFIQRNIIGNHVALVDAARAGPEARIRLDSGDARMVMSPTDRQTRAERTMPKMLRIDSITIDAEAADTQAVIDRTLAAIKDRQDAELLKLKSRTDGAEKKLATVKANTARVIDLAGRLRGKLDAMKAAMVPCDECGGTGKVADAEGAEGSCTYCDGKGSFRMHDMIVGAAKPEAAEGDMFGEDEDPVPGEDEMEVEKPATEKGDTATRRADSIRRRREARPAIVQRRADSRSRILRRAVNDRASLEVEARKHVDMDIDMAKLDEQGVKRAVLAKLKPGLKLDGRDTRFIDTAYELAIADAPAAIDQARGALRPVPIPRGDAGLKGVDKSRTDWAQSRAAAWKPPTQATK